MLRGLVIRQAFVVIDLTLAALVAFVAYLVIMRAFETGIDPFPGGGAANKTQDYDSLFAAVEPRSDYDRIIQNRLFGDAGQQPRIKEPEQGADEPGEIETPLRLRLLGTAVAGPADRVASAVIENEDLRRTKTYFIGEPVAEQRILEEIHQRQVTLFNKAENRKEILRMAEKDDEIQLAANRGSRPGPRNAPPPSPSVIDVSREELQKELSTNYAELVTQIQPEMYTDSRGRVAGITAKNISKVPLATRFGLRDGDVVQTVNGLAIDSEDKIYEIAEKLQNTSTIRLGILRGGRPQMITYNLK